MSKRTSCVVDMGRDPLFSNPFTVILPNIRLITFTGQEGLR